MADDTAKGILCSGIDSHDAPCPEKVLLGEAHCGKCDANGQRSRIYDVLRTKDDPRYISALSSEDSTWMNGPLQERPMPFGLFAVSHPDADEATLRWLVQYFVVDAHVSEIATDALMKKRVYKKFSRGIVASQLRNFVLVTAAGHPECSEAFHRELLGRWGNRVASASTNEPKRSRCQCRQCAWARLIHSLQRNSLS